MKSLNPIAVLRRLRKKVVKPADTFCLIPFQMLNVMPPGTVKPCCAYFGQINQDGQPMSVYQHSLDEIWNSAAMRALRRAMDHGEQPAECGYCFRREALGLESVRQFSARLTEMRGGNTRQLRTQAATDDYYVAAPAALDLDLGNLCNLKCRMCHSQSSSAIAADPVHSRWAPSGLVPARWRDGECVIAPARVVGVEYEGVAWPERRGDIQVAAIGCEAVIRVDTADIPLSGLSIRLAAERSENLSISVIANGQTLFDGQLPAGPWTGDFDLPPITAGSRLEITLRTAPATGASIEEIRLRRSTPGTTAVSFSRFPAGGEWFREKALLFGEILKDPRHLEHLHMIGGEPQLIKEVRDAMRHLVQLDAARNINLYMTTNASFVNDEWAGLTAKFKSVTIAVSVDGCGEVHEYVRFPAKWNDLEANLPRLRSLPNATVYLHATLQAYNMLHLADLARYCDEIGIELQHHVLESPAYLSALAMPPEVRREAARRLRAYSKEQSGMNRHSFTAAIAALELSKDTDPALIKEFMVFTNDLDVSRGQDFASTFTELKDWLYASRFEWTAERKYS